MTSASRFVMGLLLSLLASGCGLNQWARNGFKVGPNYPGPPPAAIAESWIDDDDKRVVHDPPECPNWWLVLNDPILDELIQSAYRQNLTLREAGWRVMQARSQRSIAAGNLFPQSQQGFGEYERTLESENVAVPSPLRAFDQWSTGFNLAWEIDVWGRYRRAVDSADADLEVTVGDYDAILICLIAEVATAYTDYRTFQLRLEYARHNVQIQEGSLRLTQEKWEAGATGHVGVNLAKSSLETTRAAIPSFEIGLRQASNRLCTLLGIPAQDITKLLGEGEIPTTPPEVVVGIPADLLRRRPDVRAAEWAVAAQSEQIGIAVSDLYPHFSINGEFALESDKLGNLIASASTAGAIGPSFRWDLLNYGRIINNARLQGFGLEQRITEYQNTVLTANQEVEDALVAFLQNQLRVESLKSAALETEEALKLLTISFEEGDIDFTGVFILQGELVRAQDQLAVAEGDVVTSLILLYKALGGGWEIRCGGFPAPGDFVQQQDSPEVVPTPEAVPLLDLPAAPLPDQPPVRLPDPIGGALPTLAEPSQSDADQ